MRILSFLLGMFMMSPATAEQPIFSTARTLDVIALQSIDQAQLSAELRKIFDEVIVLDESGPDTLPEVARDEKYFSFALDLWSDYQPYAAVSCTDFNAKSMSQIAPHFETRADIFSRAAIMEMDTPETRRVICTFTYWDPEDAINAFIQQADIWRTAKLGNSQNDPDPISLTRTTAVQHDLASKNGLWAMTISVDALGEEGQASLSMVIEIKP